MKGDLAEQWVRHQLELKLDGTGLTVLDMNAAIGRTFPDYDFLIVERKQLCFEMRAAVQVKAAWAKERRWEGIKFEAHADWGDLPGFHVLVAIGQNDVNETACWIVPDAQARELARRSLDTWTRLHPTKKPLHTKAGGIFALPPKWAPEFAGALDAYQDAWHLLLTALGVSP